MFRVSGSVYRDGEFQKGGIESGDEGNRFIEGDIGEAMAEGLIVPRFVNCHTHLGDAFIDRPQPGSVEDIVGPGGLKHTQMERVTEEEQVEAMHRGISYMVSTGTGAFIDFREGGLEGAKRLLKASVGLDIKPIIFGRPSGFHFDEIEMESLLQIVDGIGVSAMRDWDYEELAAVADHARSAGKPFALHASEAVREDIDAILELNPAFLVHMTASEPTDLEACAEKGVPVVVCPGSNAFFGLRPEVPIMLDLGVRVCLGTDNAMISRPDVFTEMRTLRGMFSEEELPTPALFNIAFDNGRKTLNSILGLGGEDGDYPDFMMIRSSKDDSARDLLAAELEDVILIQNRQ